MSRQHRLSVFIVVLLALLAWAPVWAQDPTDDDDSGYAALVAALRQGPATIALRDQATLQLPAGHGYLPTREASALMAAMGNSVDDNFIGLILPASFFDDEDAAAESWMVSVDFDPAGYIADDDARSWSADELLHNLKEGTEAANAEREKVGVAPLEVVGWIEPPAYDAATQRLVWSIEGRDKGAPADADNTVNYNTYVLGREGYISLNLITSRADIARQKPLAHQLLAAIAYNDGKRYAQYDATTDKAAAYGLAALVGGVAAKKLGLLAVAAAFFAKFFKLILVGLAVAGGALTRLFRRKA
ncbi:MAG: DUF2167 domain-containing protein [Dokdonella sp.]|uniref:DUF2167 domain-containing protein n=1 Tax=Dokdonella sp. TaxID=2291710 RepID=UPI0025BFF293|nr:DUF2167 domain-containing protein [Dokdonella sp.]MBX3702032.1 DUF2167 domain-containing protein [Dokdonella sp.]